MTPFVPLLLGVLATAPSATPHHEADLDSLIACERAFSRYSVEHGMRDAFLTYLSDDAIIFHPGPMKARSVWQARQPSPSTLIWEPCYAEVSGGGDLGVTTGPWEFRPPAGGDQTILYGHFVTVWRKQKDGTWKVEVDLGASHAMPDEGGVGTNQIRRGPIHEDPPSRDRSKDATREIASAERRFSDLAKQSGLAAAMRDWAAEDLRFNHEGRQPMVGRSATHDSLDEDTTSVTWAPRGSGAARSGDLGYTYGFRLRHAGATADSSIYVDVWRRERDGKWRVSLMVDNPLK